MPLSFIFKSNPSYNRTMRRAVKITLIAMGTVSVGLGVLGMFLPVMPTTPFLLLAAICYERSSEHFHRWLLTNRWFGEYIRNYREGRGMLLRQKIYTITLLWLTIGLSVMFFVPLWWVRTMLVAIATGVTIHLVRINTYRPETPPSVKNSCKTKRLEFDSD